MIGDPGELTLTETVHTMSAIAVVVQQRGGDAVLDSAWRTLRRQAHAYGVEHPEELAAVDAEVQMWDRLSRG